MDNITKAGVTKLLLDNKDFLVGFFRENWREFSDEQGESIINYIDDEHETHRENWAKENNFVHRDDVDECNNSHICDNFPQYTLEDEFKWEALIKLFTNLDAPKLQELADQSENGVLA